MNNSKAAQTISILVAGGALLAGTAQPAFAWSLDKRAARGDTTTLIEAEAALVTGGWSRVTSPLARQGTYLSAGAAGVATELAFPIEVKAPTEITVTPVWFRHGEQKRASRFPAPVPWFQIQQAWPVEDAWQDGQKPATPPPYPVPIVAKPGPDVIDVFESRAFFSAPVAGRVGILDLSNDTIAGTLDVGGYVADLVVNRARGEVCVADASGNRVVILNARNGAKLAELPVPALPWSLALQGDRLFVASMLAKTITVIDTTSRKVVQSLALPLPPQHVAVVGEGDPQLAVWLLPQTFDLKTLKELPADRLTYWPSRPYGQPPIAAETQALARAAAVFTNTPLKVYFSGDRPLGATLDAGPSLAYARSSHPSKPAPSKVYLVKPAGSAVTVLNPTNGAVLGTIELGSPVTGLRLFDYRLYALCGNAKQIHVIDCAADTLLQTLTLPYPAQEFYVGGLVPWYTTVEQISSGPMIAGVMDTRIAVGFTPLAFSPQTLAPAAPLALPFYPYPRRCSALSQDATPQRLFVDNLHTIRVNNERWIDTSAVTDYHRGRNPALLRAGDLPGTLTLSLDDGPACDWENDVWFTPDQRAMLARGTAEFVQWNAVRFTLTPGRHLLKVKAHSPYAHLDALEIRRTLPPDVDLSLQPLPESHHAQVPLPSYGGVFAASEPVSFRIVCTNQAVAPRTLTCAWEVQDYKDEIVLRGTVSVSAGARTAGAVPLTLELARPGRYTLRLKAASADGTREIFHRFLKLAPLAHPRFLYRAEDTPQISRRIKKYPLLFKRYADWLDRESGQPGFLPKTLRGSWGQNMPIENPRWHAIALQFSDLFLRPGATNAHTALLRPLLATAGGYNTWQGDYEFGGAHTILNDLMIPNSTAALANVTSGYNRKNHYLREGELQGGVFPDYLLALKEPLAPKDRATLYRIAMELNNYDGYFKAHAGNRGGNWFHDTTTWCRCPIHSMTRTFLWCRNFFDEPDFFTRPHMAGMLTLQSYVFPRYDTLAFLPHGSVRETYDKTNNTAALRWALSGLSRQPLEKTYYQGVFDCIARLNGPMTNEQDEVNALLRNGSAAVIPMYLALGWLDPDRKGVQWEEMPPGMLFDVEGAACMKSGWDTNMTDIYFVSGVKDISYRALPNHFHLFKAGEMVVGAIRQGDHANPVSFFGNCVRVGEDERYPFHTSPAWGYYRQSERWLTDRRSPLGTTYMYRDWRLSGYRQEGTRWEGGGHPHAFPEEMTLHSHTAHPFTQEGGILAYETNPEFDYVVGDASNFWPLEDVEEMVRQFLYIRPDVVVIYDRMTLGPLLRSTKWPLMTLRNTASPKGNPTLNGSVFTSANGTASLWGQAFLPVGATLKAATIGIGEGWKPNAVGYVEITPKEKQRNVEYLVVLRAGLASPTPLECRRVDSPDQAGLTFTYEGRDYTVGFNRRGPVGGRIRIANAGKVLVERELAPDVRDTYANWKNDPRFHMWMTDERFRTYVTERDRESAGGARPR